MGAAETSNEVVFEGLYGAFRKVAAVKACRCELVSDVFIVHVIFHQI